MSISKQVSDTGAAERPSGMITHVTRKATEEQLRTLGVEGPAAQAILRETATLRHENRVQRTLGAALAECGQTHGLGAACRECAVRVLADLMGIGGHAGVAGAASVRHPAFWHLGKGRKFARDGAAWAAAAEDALTRLVGGGPFVVTTQIVLAALGEEPEWARTIAREGLRLSLGLEGWFVEGGRGSFALPDGILFDGSPQSWAEVVNWAEARIAEAAAAKGADEPPESEGGFLADLVTKVAVARLRAAQRGWREGFPPDGEEVWGWWRSGPPEGADAQPMRGRYTIADGCFTGSEPGREGMAVYAKRPNLWARGEVPPAPPLEDEFESISD